MDIESFRNYCLSLADTTEEFPFGPDTIVFKIGGKIFALAGIENFDSINLKCDPELVTELRERYPAVQPGYHMNKKHWNTIVIDHSIADSMIREWIKHSYDLVSPQLPRKQKTALKIPLTKKNVAKLPTKKPKVSKLTPKKKK